MPGHKALTIALTIMLTALLGACEQNPSKYDYHGTDKDLANPDLIGSEDLIVDPLLDVMTPDGTELPDEDQTNPTDLEDMSGDDSGETPDEVSLDTLPEDTVDPPLSCGNVLFEYAAAPEVQQVLVSGSFNNWQEDASTANAMTDDDGDDLWTLVLSLEPGVYQYKFVVDGDWIPDPGNPDQVPDNYDGFNSVLTVEECPTAGDLVLVSHETGPGTFTAQFEATGGISIDSTAITVSVDWEPAEASEVTVDGTDLTVELKGLSDGIHDIRVEIDGQVYLLKVYINLTTDWREALLYFVMTDRFSNGNADNDKPVEGVDWRTNYQGGDFAGVTQKIADGYFDDLGVGAIWLSWPVDNPDGFHVGGRPSEHYCDMNPKTAQYTETQYTGYHGYWPSKLYKTDEHFGTLDELQDLVVAAHQHGIRILLDFTANHVHESSPFFQDHKDDNFFHFPDEICQDVGWDTKPITCWFTSYLPDLNYSNPASVNEVLDYAIWWAKQTGADGFRLDAVKHIEFEFITALRSRVKKELELTDIDFYIVGETFTGKTDVIKSFIGPDKIHGQFDFPANLNMLKGFATYQEGLDTMDEAIRGYKAYYGNSALMSNFIGNHDIARFISQASGMISCGLWDVVSNIAQGWLNPPDAPSDYAPYQKLQLAFTYAMTVPGVPLVYYGDEFGMPGAGDPDNRRMMRFGNDLSQHEKDTLAFLKKLGMARREHPVLAKGDWTQSLWSEVDFLAYGRIMAGERAVIMLNRGDQDKSGDLNLLPTTIAGGTQMEEIFTGQTATVSNELNLSFNVPPRTAQIWITK
jgi:neopullulanase